jgi:RNA polymerase sigma factor (sigma-70 family)
VSPLHLRRYRAERLLRDEFESLQGRVIANVRGRLQASSVSLDHDELQACYAAAWQGLYAVLLEGGEVANPAGWLTIVTHRRAIDEHRARHSHDRVDENAQASAVERDLAAELDDRVRLRQLFEGLRQRLDGREREAATLCYLQGLTRSQAAMRMGVSDGRMRKLMEGPRPGRPGVAGKVGALVHTIQAGEWCAEQGSLMRAFAYGILDPQGERYQLALAHSDQCPACRAYVASLRGLAAVLPPVFLPWGLAGAALAQVGQAAHSAGVAGGAGAAGTSGGASSGATGAGLQAGGRIGGAVSASGAAGAGGAASGGWLAGAGPLGAKLAVGCLLALGAGASCVALDGGQSAFAPRHRHHPVARSGADDHPSSTALTSEALVDLADDAGNLGQERSARKSDVSTALTTSDRASREFGLEQTLAGGGASLSPHATAARVASARSESSQLAASSSNPSSSNEPASASVTSGSVAAASGGDSAAAEREFAPG